MIDLLICSQWLEISLDKIILMIICLTAQY